MTPSPIIFFIRQVRYYLQIFLDLLRDPEEGWTRLKKAEREPKSVYYFLIFPLTVLLGLIVFINQASFDDFTSAGAYFLIEAAVGLLNVYSAASLLVYMNSRFRGVAEASQIQATAPFIVVPWILAAILSAVFAELLPLLANTLGLILFVAATVTGIYMLYSYTVHYLQISAEKRNGFLVLAVIGLILISALLSWVEADLVATFIEH